MYLRPSLIKGGGVLKKSQKTNSVILFYREKNNHRRKKISPAVTMYKRPMGQRHGPRHGLLARPMGGTAGSVLVSARHAGPCGSWAAGLAHDTALARHGGTSPPLLASPPPDRISFASSRIFSASPPLLFFHGWRAPSRSTAARRARTSAPWPMGGTGGTARGKRPMCRVMGWSPSP
jgi:hypothetical protein